MTERSASAASASSSDATGRALDRERVRDLEHGEEMARVAFALVDEVLERVVVDLRGLVPEAALPSSARRTNSRRSSSASGSSRNSVLREQRTGEREERVLGGRADEHEQAFLDEGEQHVLLGAGEAVDLVEEEDRSRPRSPSRARARSATSRTSFTPALTADSVSNLLR